MNIFLAVTYSLFEPSSGWQNAIPYPHLCVYVYVLLVHTLYSRTLQILW